MIQMSGLTLLACVLILLLWAWIMPEQPVKEPAISEASYAAE